MTHDDALPALPIGEAEVLWHEPDPVMPERPGKIIDASHAFMDAAPLGTRLYSAEQMRAYVRADRAAHAEPSRCPHIRSSGTGEWATNWCALAEQPALHEAARLALDALEESRDDVNEAINSILHGEGYPSFDRRIKQAREQLARHDAAIAALRAALDAARRDGGEG